MEQKLGSALFGELNVELRSTLLEAGKLRRYRDGELIAARGARDAGLSIIEQGAVRMSSAGGDGRQTSAGTLQTGDSFGEFTVFAGAPRQFDFIAVGATAVRFIPKTAFQRLMSQSPMLRDALIEVLARKLLLTLDMLEDMRRLPLTPRAAKQLLLWSVPAGDGVSACWQGSQTELAELLGVTRVSVGHLLRELRELGLVTTGYGRIDLPNVAKLKAWLKTVDAFALGG